MRLSAEQMEQRKLDMLEAAFALFSERGIDSVSMQEVADAAGIGVASVYRYFSDKATLVVETAIWKWREYLDEVNVTYSQRNGESMNALEEFEFYLDSYIELYRNHPDILRFNAEFDLYVQREHVSGELLAAYNTGVDRFLDKFHMVRRKALLDRTMRIDLDENELYYTAMYSMLSLAEKFSFGIVYPANDVLDRDRALSMQKQMLMNYVLPQDNEEREGSEQDG